MVTGVMVAMPGHSFACGRGAAGYLLDKPLARLIVSPLVGYSRIDSTCQGGAAGCER